MNVEEEKKQYVFLKKRILAQKRENMGNFNEKVNTFRGGIE